MVDRFAFGANWSEYASLIDTKRIEAATDNLRRLLPELVDWEQVHQGPPTFLDIGCGSGIHALAAASMGARVTAIDIDADSVRTTRELMDRMGLEDQVTVQEASILDWQPGETFDVVYSWGVLHHTGRMWEAFARAVALMSPDPRSRLAIALYRRTKACGFWKAEKKWYAGASPLGQKLARAAAGTTWDLARLRAGVSPWAYRRDYYRQRGMSVSHDLHDWLGGYPYESATPSEIRSRAASHGLAEVRSFVYREEGLESGFMGSGCDEFVFGPTRGATDRRESHPGGSSATQP